MAGEIFDDGEDTGTNEAHAPKLLTTSLEENYL